MAGIARDGAYEPQVMSLLNRLVRPDDICIDCGANIGVLTLLLSRLCPEGRVYAFEPDEGNRSYLVRNLATNGAANVVVSPVGVYDLTGVLDLHIDPRHPGGSFMASTTRTAATVAHVQVTRLDDWVSAEAMHRVDVLKLDIEGAEVRAIEGAAQLLRRWRPLCIAECNPVALRRFHGARATDLVDALTDVYGNVFYIEEDGVRRLESEAHLDDVLGHCGIVDLVCGDRARPLLREPPPQPGPGRARRLVGTALRRAGLRAAARAPLPRVNYVFEPDFEASIELDRLVGRRGSSTTLPVTIRNTTMAWWSSDFPEHPVFASYHWLDEHGARLALEGLRTGFVEPVGPGDEVQLHLAVAFPHAPGEYVLAFSPVQEGYAWFDDLRPELTIDLPVTVR
jgi:FkbM family methyltransferase